MAKCYLYANDGFFAGESEAYRRLPANASFTPPPPRPWIRKWPRFVNGEWLMEEDHRERTEQLFKEDVQEATRYWLPEDTWESQPKTINKPGPLPEGALLQRPEKPESTLEETKAEAVAKVDAATSAAILAGFDYQLNDQLLHFSYDSFDQQNFADSANVASRSLSGETGLPQSVTWNAYKNWNGQSGELVRIELAAADFLALYTVGALGHKAACMERGGQQKTAIALAQNNEAVGALLTEWGL